MKLSSIPLGLTYDDLLLIPLHSSVVPSETKVDSYLTKDIHLNIPLVAAAMDTVSESALAIALARVGGIAIIHKNLSIERQAEEVKKVKEADASCSSAATDKKGRLLVGAAIGANKEALERAKALIESGVDVLTLDSAHGHSDNIIATCKLIKASFPSTPLIVGNIVTAEAALALKEAGADAVKVGIGPGSICTTRIVSGVGYPQASAVDEVVNALKGSEVKVIADGGIKYSGDIVKALALGASSVMLGSLFAATKEAPGACQEINGKMYKTYVGMGSLAAMQRGSADRYFQAKTTKKEKLVPEGIEGILPLKGSVEEVVYQLMGGVRSGMGYCGAKDLKALASDSRFVRITDNGLKESHPHDVKIAVEAPNYSSK